MGKVPGSSPSAFDTYFALHLPVIKCSMDSNTGIICYLLIFTPAHTCKYLLHNGFLGCFPFSEWIIYSLQQIVAAYKLYFYSTAYTKLLLPTIHWPIYYIFCTLFHQSVSCYTFDSLLSANQRAIIHLYCCLANQWGITLFALSTCTRKTWLQHYLTFIAVFLTRDCDIVIWLFCIN